MLFIVINGVFAFLFLNLPFVPSFFLLFTFCENKYQKCLRKVIEYTKNIQKSTIKLIFCIKLFAKNCLISKKYVSLHPIFVSCLIFKRENYGKKIDHAHGGARSFNRNGSRSNYCYR